MMPGAYEEPEHDNPCIQTHISGPEPPFGRKEMVVAFQIVRCDVEEYIVCIIWMARPFVSISTETFVVADNRNRAQTYLIVGSEPDG